jgi:hypothetical protein
MELPMVRIGVGLLLKIFLVNQEMKKELITFVH